MNRNVLIVLAGGFLIAVLVALLVQASLSSGRKEPEPAAKAEAPRVKIVVAAKPIKIGEELTEENIKWIDWPKDATFPGAVIQEADKKPTEMIKGRVRRSLNEGEPVVESALVSETQGNFLAASIAPGMRAVAIKVKAATMAGGFIGPGDYADILLTYKDKISYSGDNADEMKNLIHTNIDSMATETILQNIKILAVDQSSTRGGEDEKDKDKVKVGKTVTVEVDYKGAEILALASQFGDLSLALRRLGDESIVFDKPPVTTDARITNIYDEVLKKINEVSGDSKIVRVYRGDAVQDISVHP